MARDLLLFGPPGAGKGTQADAVSAATGLPHLATGDMFRENLRAGTPLGREAKSYMERGALVPDEVTIGMLEERLRQPDAAAGFLLDGFPRNEVQAHALDGLLEGRGGVTAVLSLEVDPDEVVRRIAGRLLCPTCGAIYHETDAPPQTPGRCDVEGAELKRRDDDREEVVRERLDVFERQTAPVLDHYRRAGVPVIAVDGARSREAVEADLVAAVRSLPS